MLIRGKTEKYEVVLGTAVGYDNAIDTSDSFFQVYNDIAIQNPYLYIPITSDDVNVIYKSEWGCPENGEMCIRFTSQRNPKFDSDKNKFERAMIWNIKQLKQKYQQKTVQMTRCDDVNFYYFTD